MILLSSVKNLDERERENKNPLQNPSPLWLKGEITPSFVKGR